MKFINSFINIFQNFVEDDFSLFVFNRSNLILQITKIAQFLSLHNWFCLIINIRIWNLKWNLLFSSNFVLNQLEDSVLASVSFLLANFIWLFATEKYFKNCLWYFLHFLLKFLFVWLRWCFSKTGNDLFENEECFSKEFVLANIV